MSNNGKKIAFSFSKVKKPPLLNKVDVEHKEKREYVDCFDGSKGKFSYKGSYRNDAAHKPELVIPMPVGKTSAEYIKSRIEEKTNKNLDLSQKNNDNEKNSEKKIETSNLSHNIEELATLEILNDVKNSSTETKKTSNLIIEANDLSHEASETVIDYENVPVTDFGLAMLRGMGWKPGCGIGKEPRIVEAVSPKVRLKGLGLGAQLSAETHKEKEYSEKKGHKNFPKEKREKH